MPATPIVPVPEYEDLETVRPQDNDDIFMDGGPAPQWPVWQKLYNRAQYSRGTAWGQLLWNGVVEVSGTAASPVVKVGPIDAVPLRAQETRNGSPVNVWKSFFTAAEQTLGISQVEGTPGSLSADTFYNVFVYSNGGTSPLFQISTSPPTDSGAPSIPLLWKRGQVANYRHLATFRTDSSGNPIPQRTQDKVTLYRRSAITNVNNVIASGGLAALSSTAAVTLTARDISGRVPPHAKSVILFAELRAVCTSTPGTDVLSLYGAGDSTSPAVTLNAYANVALERAYNSATVELDCTGQTFGYVATLSTNSFDYAVHILGWR